MRKKLLQSFLVMTFLTAMCVVANNQVANVVSVEVSTQSDDAEFENVAEGLRVGVAKNTIPIALSSYYNDHLVEEELNKVSTDEEAVINSLEDIEEIGNSENIEEASTDEEEAIESFEETEIVFNVTDVSKTMYTTTVLNVRDNADVSANKLGVLNNGKEVQVTGICDNNWTRVEYKGNVAYVSSSYLADEKPKQSDFIKVSATAYYNPNGNKTADGSATIADLTLAGRKSWLGKGCYLYRCNKDGSVGDCMGYYEFHDTGWGIDGDILRGETIDIYMNTYNECIDWGRRNVYIKFVE